MFKLVILSVLAVFIGSSFVTASFAYGTNAQTPLTTCNYTPQIKTVTKITTVKNEVITITGTNFCKRAPAWDPALGWLSSEGKGCGGVSDLPTIQVTDMTSHWSAGRETCTSTDSYGLNGANSNTPPSWTNMKIVYHGVGGSPMIKVGDKILIEIWSCNQACDTTFTTTVS